MKNCIHIGFLAATIFGFQACAHSHIGGSVLHKEGDGSAHICLGENLVKQGDKMAVYDVKCDSGRRGTELKPTPRRVCKKTKVGEATVVEVTDEHFSRIQPIGQIELEKGQVVERLP